MSEIKSLSIVCQQGVKQYFVGQVYDGLKLDCIDDRSLEFVDTFHSVFIGWTDRLMKTEKVFQVYGAPVDVQYGKSAENVELGPKV
jgi:hypothetical protein